MTDRQYRQHIPRPQASIPGGIAPWAGLAAERRRPIRLGQVVAALEPLLAPADEEPEERPTAAVLVPLFELGDATGGPTGHTGELGAGKGERGERGETGESGETGVLLIRRSRFLASNPGDIAFPGGRLEPGEPAVQAALREAEEEVALPPGSVRVLGRMEMVVRSRRGGRIAPYLGILATPPSGLVAQPYEVDELLVVALADLAEEGAYWEERWELPDEGERVLSFFSHVGALGDDVIWGMTARVLRQLLSAVLLAPGSPGSGDPGS